MEVTKTFVGSAPKKSFLLHLHRKTPHQTTSIHKYKECFFYKRILQRMHIRYTLAVKYMYNQKESADDHHRMCLCTAVASYDHMRASSWHELIRLEFFHAEDLELGFDTLIGSNHLYYYRHFHTQVWILFSFIFDDCCFSSDVCLALKGL
jgi:hypothetical protein